ncbi:MAG: hypothetical protein ACI8PT_000439 [Gammaproteobacteria bacterium]|jgi:hypothetical protein
MVTSADVLSVVAARAMHGEAVKDVDVARL